MSDALESAMRLSQVIGARPAGTEEEQQASFFIEEQLQKAGLETAVEEFNCNPNYEIPRFVCCVVTVVLGILAIFLPLMLVISLVVTFVTAILFSLEMLGFSPLNNFAKRGISQNIIAKYDPNSHGVAVEALDADPETISGTSSRRSKGGKGSARGASRKRKIIVLARYDSGRVCPELKAPYFKFLNYIHWAELAGMILVPVMLLVRFVCDAQGALLIICDIISIVAIVAAFLPILKYVTHQTAQYSEGANNNAAGVAVMIEVAKQIAKTASAQVAPEDVIPGVTEGTAPVLADGSHPEAEGDITQDLVIMHGKEAMAEAKVLPVDADLVYEEVAEGSMRGNPVEAMKEEAARAQEALEQDDLQYGPSDAKTQSFDEKPIRHHEPKGASNSMSLEAMMETASSEYRGDNELLQSSETLRFGDSHDGMQASSANAHKAPAVPAQEPAAPPKEAAEKASNIAIRPSTKLGEVKTMGVITGTQRTSAAVPDWFTAAKDKANAKKAERGEKDAPIMRSKFSDALDAAAQSSANAIETFEARETERATAETVATAPNPSGSSLSEADEAKLEQLQARIMGKADAEEALLEHPARPRGVDAVFGDDPVAEVNATAAEAIAEIVVEGIEDSAAKPADVAAEDIATGVENVAEMAAVADRTISYIPVAESINAIEVSEADTKDPIGKTASDILAEAAAAQEQAEESDEEEAAPAKEGRKKRTISLPSLTGAIEAMEEQKQSAPLAEGASTPGSKQRARRRAELTGLPSTDKPSDSKNLADAHRSPAATVAGMSRKEASERMSATARSDAEKALASLDVEVVAATDAGSTEGSQAAPAAASATSAEAADATQVEEKAVLQQLTPSATSQFEHVRADLIANIESDDIVVGDADDSDYAENTTHTGAMAGPGYVEMPKSRVERFRGLFGRKKKRTEASFIEAVGIDEDFDARKVGKERGDWSSFQNESADYDARISGSRKDSGRHADKFDRNSISFDSSEINESWDDDAWNDDWNGGAFSLGRKARAEGSHDGRKSRRSPKSSSETSRRLSDDDVTRKPNGDDATRKLSANMSTRRLSSSYEDESIDDEYEVKDTTQEGVYDEMIDERQEIRKFHAGSPVDLGSSPRKSRRSSFSEVAAFANEIGDDVEVEVEETVEASGAFQTEVWFVALGAELADNAGIKAFLSHHSDELSGAVVIDLEGLGAGTLSVIGEEGTIKAVKAPSRMKRYVSKAASSLGMKVGTGKIRWRDSAAFFTASKGVQTLHLAGMSEGKPAYFGEADDVWENIDDGKLMQNSALVVELMNLI